MQGERAKKLDREGSTLNKRMRTWVLGGIVTLFTLMLLTAWLAPFGYMLSTSLKTIDQISDPTGPLYPAAPAKFTYQDKEYDVYTVPAPDGKTYDWALITKGRESSEFVDPANPDAGLIHWIGRWRTLKASYQFAPQWQNYAEAYDLPSRSYTFGTLLFNTVAIAFFGIIGTVISCTLVAYGFSRFRIPHKNLLFLMLVSSIFLPRLVLTVPTYALFLRIGWVGSWLPLIVPHFFANAYNVFWLRQYLMTIPREMDEAAMIDGAGPFQILRYIIVPQLMPAIVTVALFHMVFAFRDYFEPLIYLSSKPELQPISVGIQQFNALFGQQPQLIQTMALLGLIVPVVIFFFAQRAFRRGIVFTGVEK